MRIVDEHGKPFKPSFSDQVDEVIGRHVPDMLKIASENSVLAEQIRIEELRRSCGIEPEVKTITFRRYLPYQV